MQQFLEDCERLLTQNSPRDEWVRTLCELIRYSDGEESVMCGGDMISLLSKKLNKEVDESISNDTCFDTELIDLIFNSVRIILRAGNELSDNVLVQLMTHLFTVLRLPDKAGLHYTGLAIAAVRCLINLTYKSNNNMRIFLSREVDGLLGLTMLLERVEVTHDTNCGHMTLLPYYAVRLLNMLVSLCDAVRSRLLPTELLTHRLIAALIAYLERCTMSEHAASGGSSSSSDEEYITDFPYSEENAKLFNEICKVLFAADVHMVLSNMRSNEDSGPFPGCSAGRLLRVISSVLRSSTQEGDSVAGGMQQSREDCEEHCLQLLMYCSDDFTEGIVASADEGAAERADADVLAVPEHVVRMLSRTLDATQQIADRDRAGKLTPLLIALNQFSSRAETVKRQIKSLIFPNDWSLPDNSGPLGSQRNIDPRDAPVGTLREKLLRLMTSLDTHVKRCAAELVFTLCDENPDEFVGRCGFGNAVQLLQIKGLC